MSDTVLTDKLYSTTFDPFLFWEPVVLRHISESTSVFLASWEHSSDVMCLLFVKNYAWRRSSDSHRPPKLATTNYLKKQRGTNICRRHPIWLYSSTSFGNDFFFFLFLIFLSLFLLVYLFFFMSFSVSLSVLSTTIRKRAALWQNTECEYIPVTQDMQGK